MNRSSHRRGFTVVEVLVVVGGLASLGSVGSVMMGLGSPGMTSRAAAQPEDDRIKKIREEIDSIKKQIVGLEKQVKEIEEEKKMSPSALGKARAAARQMKDATQVRGIGQALIIWANQNQGRYPLPSKIDAANTTLAGPAESKDTTSNIFSMLIFNGMISSEICVSPAEAQANIKVNDKYELDNPRGAAKPADALWDPAFSADFTNGKTGGVSYAHLQPFGARLKQWQDTFVSTEAVVGNRGPEIASVRNEKGESKVKTKIDNSITYLIHGERNSWEGNMSFNDNHVEFLTTLVGDSTKGWPAYVNKEEKRTPDVLFFDETDSKEPAGNLYLGIFTKAGKELGDWTAIWD